jgi:uncharacterized protein YggU (UPF0235/DUF167 family)
VRLTPKGGHDALEGWETDRTGRAFLKARVRAVPENGKANNALVELLAEVLEVPRSDVRISSGAKSRLKMVRVSGNASALADRLRKSGGGN